MGFNQCEESQRGASYPRPVSGLLKVNTLQTELLLVKLQSKSDIKIACRGARFMGNELMHAMSFLLYPLAQCSSSHTITRRAVAISVLHKAISSLYKTDSLTPILSLLLPSFLTSFVTIYSRTQYGFFWFTEPDSTISTACP